MQRTKPTVTTFLICIVAIGLKLQMEGMLEPNSFPLLFLAVGLSAWKGGLQQGLLACFLCSAADLYYFIPPLYSFDITKFQDGVKFISQTCAKFLTALLTSSLYEARKKAVYTSRQKTVFFSEIATQICIPIQSILKSTLSIQQTQLTSEQMREIKVIEEAGKILLVQFNHVLASQNVPPTPLNISLDLKWIYLDLMPSRLRVMEEAIQANDLLTVERLARVCRTGAGALGYTNLLKICNEIESEAQAKDGKHLTSLLLQVRAEFYSLQTEFSNIHRAA